MVIEQHSPLNETVLLFFFEENDMRIPDTETFLVPCATLLGKRDDEFAQLLYSPLRDELALVDYEAARRILKANPKDEEYIEMRKAFYADEIAEIPVRDITQTHQMSILPNLKCNFACSYCYSAKGRSNMELDWDKAKSALDYFISTDRIHPCNLRLFISGGGEPLISWPLTEKIITYACQRAEEQKFSLHIGLITNASLVDDDIAESLSRCRVTVGVSFEVLEDLQNVQRKNYDAVRRGISILLAHGCTVKFNSTITPVSVHRMREMVNAVAHDYPDIAAYTMEPVTAANLFESAADLRTFYDTFIDEYVECRHIARQKGIPLRFTFDDTQRGTVVRHCPGKFCVTPTGALSACHLVSSPKEDRYDECTYGQVTERGVELNKDKFSQLYQKNVLSYPECKDCFAKWDCGGECLTRRSTYPADYMHEVCRFNRRILKLQLLERVRETILSEMGISIEEYLNN